MTNLEKQIQNLKSQPEKYPVQILFAFIDRNIEDLELINFPLEDIGVKYEYVKDAPGGLFFHVKRIGE